MQLRLRASALDFWVDVRLCSFGGRWIAVADIGGEPELGLAGTVREALEDSLSSLGPSAAAKLLEDPRPYGARGPVAD